MCMNLRMIFILAILCILALPVLAIVSEYSFESTAGNYVELSGGTVLNTAGQTNPVFNAIALGFSFTYNGLAYSSVSIAENGFLAMGDVVLTNNLAISSATGTNNIIAVLNRDLVPRTDGELSYQLSGSIPNRVFTVQWKNFRRSPTTAANDVFNFQIKLYESSNTINFCYGSFTTVTISTAATIQVGLRGDSNSDFLNRKTTTDWASTEDGTANNNNCTLSATVYPSSGLTFVFSPPTALDEQPVTIESDPAGANVYIGGTYVGTTPYITTIFEGSSYEVSVSLDGYSFADSPQTVSYMDQPQTISFLGSLMPVYVHFSSWPEANIYISETGWSGLTPCSLEILPGETWSVYASPNMPGYTFVPDFQMVTYSGTDQYIDFAGFPDIPPEEPQYVDISSDPMGAEIYVNGSPIGSTPCGFMLNPGESADLTASYPGYTFDPQWVSYVPFTLVQPIYFQGYPDLPPEEPQIFEITSTPSGADVYLNGNLAGTTPFYSMINPGESFDVSLSLTGWSFENQNAYFTPMVPMIMDFVGVQTGFTLSGFAKWQYNESEIPDLSISLNSRGAISSRIATTTNEMGEFFFENLAAGSYTLSVSQQSISVNGSLITIASKDTVLTIAEDTVLDLYLQVNVPISSSNCTLIGTFGGKKYWRSNWTGYWPNFRDNFASRGGYMVSINSAAENQFIANYIAQQGGNHYLGMYYDGGWHWVDGSPVSYTNWSPGEPSGDSECVQMLSDGTWNDLGYWSWQNAYGIMEDPGVSDQYIPEPITNLSLSQQRDFTINLSWTNPAEVACGLSLNPGFEVVIIRDGEIVQTLTDGQPTAISNWQDTPLTGMHTYQVYVQNEYGQSSRVTSSVQYGNQLQGIARLSNTSDHSGILVRFIADPSTPAAVSDSTYTNANGFYSINLVIGRYNILYSKTGYLDASNYNYLHSAPAVLSEQTLEYVGPVQYLSGALSGTINADYTYIINGTISVENGQSLVLQPGVRFYFKQGIGFNVNGTLTAIGNAQSPIIFSSVGTEVRGEMWLNNSESILQYCEFTKGYYGFRVNSNVHLSYSKIHHNNIGVDIHNSSSPLIEYCEFYAQSEHGVLSYSYGTPRVEHCEFYNNQLSGHIMYCGWDRSIQFDYNYVHHNSSNSYMFYKDEGWGSFTMQHNIIEHNSGNNYLLCFNHGYGVQANISNNIMRYNTCADLVSLSRTQGTFFRNQIYDNTGSVTIYTNSNYYSDFGSTMTVTNNTIVGNTGTGLQIDYIHTVKNNIIAFNGGTELVYNSSSPTIQFNLVYDTTGTIFQNAGGLPFLLDLQAQNANGTPCDTYSNISLDPQFFDLANDNFNLLASSPCINAGDPNLALDADATVADLGALYFDLNANTHAQISVPHYLYNFQATALGSSSVWNCPVRNTGTDALNISLLELNNPAFTIVQNTRTEYASSLSIAPNETAYIPIRFTPQAVVAYADTLIIHSNALLNPIISIRIFGSGTLGASVALSMPQNTVVYILSDFSLPISISDPTVHNIVAFNLSLSFDPAKLEFIGLNTEGSLAEDWFVAANSTSNGALYIGGSGPESLSAAGTLIRLNFRTLGGIADGTESFINIPQVVFNEGGLTVQGCFAGITIRNIIYGDVDDNLQIQAYDAALTLQYSVMMDPLPQIDPRPWIDWRKIRADVSGDGNIFAYDASLILQRVVGLISTFPAEQSRPNPPTSDLSITYEAGSLVLSCSDFSALYSLNLSLPLSEQYTLGNPVFSPEFSEYISTINSDEANTYLGFAGFLPPNGSGIFCQIPILLSAATTIPISYTINEVSGTVSVNCEPTSNPEVPSLVGNFLHQNAPNPFVKSTTIHYGVKDMAPVQLTIYNLKGQVIRKLISGEQKSGLQQCDWDCRDENGKLVSSGVYLYRLKIGESWEKSSKMMLMKH